MNNTGILLINLGTPDSPSIPDVRRYLDQFLMDGYVLDVPWLLRRLIVSGFILPFRPKKSAAAYQAIWAADGSPLLTHSLLLQERLEEKLRTSSNMPVALGMRYGAPSIESAVDALLAQSVEHIVAIPLYPQYADSTVTTSVAEIKRLAPAHVSVQVTPPFYDHPGFIQALASTVAEAMSELGTDGLELALNGDAASIDHVLMSYHGLPDRHLKKADPTGAHCLSNPDCCNQASPAHATCYRHQVFKTSAALAQALGLHTEQYTVSFQSRLGAGWMQPYTDKVLAELAQQGVRRLLVVCPAFVADNLETLEEMGMQGREIFLNAGGEEFHLAPCLNTHPQWIDALQDMISTTIAPQ